MIKFIVYQTKLLDNKLTFELWDSYDEYDTAMEIAETYPNMVVMPFDDEDPDEE